MPSKPATEISGFREGDYIQDGVRLLRVIECAKDGKEAIVENVRDLQIYGEDLSQADWSLVKRGDG